MVSPLKNHIRALLKIPTIKRMFSSLQSSSDTMKLEAHPIAKIGSHYCDECLPNNYIINYIIIYCLSPPDTVKITVIYRNKTVGAYIVEKAKHTNPQKSVQPIYYRISGRSRFNQVIFRCVKLPFHQQNPPLSMILTV